MSLGLSQRLRATSDAYLEGADVSEQGGRSPTFLVDALTINPYLGGDGVLPFVKGGERSGRGVFVLVKTSNPSSSEIQDLMVRQPEGREVPLFHVVARKVDEWGSVSIGKCGYSLVGAVVGATFPREAHVLRGIMPRALFLVPGVGAQGGNLSTLPEFFNDDGHGALIAASRSLIYVYRDEEWAGLPFDEATRRATTKLRKEVQTARDTATHRSPELK